MKRRALLWIAVALPAGVCAQAPGFTLPPIDEFSAMVERPLFAPSRRPAADRVLAPAATLSAGAWRLVGLVRSGQGRTIALVRNEDSKSEVRLAPGAKLNGWTVAALDGRGVELTAGSRRLRVRLKDPIPPPP